jgi:hypothetical protein
LHKVYIKDCGGSAWKVLKRDTSKCNVHKDLSQKESIKNNKYLRDI